MNNEIINETTTAKYVLNNQTKENKAKPRTKRENKQKTN